MLGEAVGTVSRGISQAAIDALPRRPYAPRRHSGGGGEGSQQREQEAEEEQ